MSTTNSAGPLNLDREHQSGVMLSVRDLHVHFPTPDGLVKAVDGLSYDLEHGKTLGIVGESGSGKSVSTYAIMGLHRDTRAHVSGEIIFDGDDLLTLPSDDLREMRGRDIAMVFQDPLSALHPYYTVGNQIVEAYRVHNDVTKTVARNHVIDMLGRVGIPNPARRIDQYPHEFSGGMRQRVAIAIALLHRPALIIADEPTTALDVTIQVQILRLLAELKTELGLSLVLITHDLGVVARIADDVAVMYAGEIIEEGSVADVFSDPRHPYTRGLMRAIPVPGRTAAGAHLGVIPGTVPSLIGRQQGCAFRSRCDIAQPRCADTVPLMDDGDHRWRCIAGTIRHPEPLT